MGTKRRDNKPQTSIAGALFAGTKKRVLSLVFGQPDRAFGTSEMIGLVGAGSGAVQRELQRLAAAGLVTATAVGRQKLYQANRGSPIFEELTGIVAKTAGVADAVRKSLEHLAPRLRIALLYGSVAKQSDRANSDVDLLLVGEGLTLEDAYAALEPAERALGRRISPTIYTSEEFDRRRRTQQPFLTRVLAGKHIVIVGDVDGAASTR